MIIVTDKLSLYFQQLVDMFRKIEPNINLSLCTKESYVNIT